MPKMTFRSCILTAVSIVSGLLFAGCESETPETDGIWAINVGGPAYTGIDSTPYLAEESVSGGQTAALDTVLGSQDAILYQYYRRGDIKIAHGLANGTYDITLYFAEPDDVEGGERVFDVLIEGGVAIDDLDVMAWRDGKIESALTITVRDVEISDEELNVAFAASAGEPVLSALLVRGTERAPVAWELAWSDEFDQSGRPNPEKWSIDEWPARKVNDEDQAYTARSKNIRVEGGKLIVEAHKEDYENAVYTSGRIHSLGKGDFLYGRAEVRARLPQGKGTWAAIWMLPSDPFRYATMCEEGDEWQGSPTCDAWPNSGEIDIMEHVGYQMGHVHGTVHNKAYYWLTWEQRKGRILLDDVAENWHLYALEWTPEKIDIFVDDTLYFTYINENSGWEAWPYDHPYHLVLNVAVGGQWGRSGGGIDDSIFPQRMIIDYARVYRRKQ